MWILIAFISWILTAYFGLSLFKLRKQLNALAASAAAWCDRKHG